MAPALPSSLSPHICILPTPDLSELLESCVLPSLPNVLQSFSPLPQVTTRTTSLASVPHSSFALRFSDLAEVEEACREDEDQRAVRTLDWMTSRMSDRCNRWVKDTEARGDKEGIEEKVRTPWWDELRRCAEGDFVPQKTEGWNHPVAVILAVSTTAPNPLQAITALHSRNLQFPPWVDTTFLRYTLIVHPKNSPLSDEEAGALFNAVKKQFGLHSYLLPLNLPSPPPPPIPVPAALPRLPAPSSHESPLAPQIVATPASANRPGSPEISPILNTLRMDEKDIQQTARFTREFVVMSLIPWMEKCVVEWNETYSATRRLPSRLFSTTRRLFGSPSPSPALTHSASTSVSSLPVRSNTTMSMNGAPSPPSQHRRLAEFATILGDFKLAVSVWESLRKESKGGSDILPLLLASSPALQLHASNALASIHPPVNELPPHAQIRALLYAVRWEVGIDQREFLSAFLEGERWLVLAAGNAEEAPSALLLAHAALLSSVKKQATRRAAFWYVAAANRLEKCGIKPLTMYFLRKAQELYQVRPLKELSPSFWESEGRSPLQAEGIVDTKSAIEHPLGRLLYTTGSIDEAVRIFLGTLQGNPCARKRIYEIVEDSPALSDDDKTFLDDFRVAFSHLQSTEPNRITAMELRPPVTFCVSKQSKLRFLDDSISSESAIWRKRESQWNSFWKEQGGMESLLSGNNICTDELFWVDLVVLNPFDAEINLSNLTLIVDSTVSNSARIGFFIEVETVKDVVLGARESRTVAISLKAKEPASLIITGVRYHFLSLLPTTESLASRGRRLHSTPAQRQKPTYAPDVLMKINIVPAYNKLAATFIDDGVLDMKQGEIRSLTLWLSNVGLNSIQEIWLVGGDEGDIWLGDDDTEVRSTSTTEVLRIRNSLKVSQPQRISLSKPLQQGTAIKVSLLFHAERLGSNELQFLFVFREANPGPFHCTRLARMYDVQPLLDLVVSAKPSRRKDRSYTIDIEMVCSSTTGVQIQQISTLSPLWRFCAISPDDVGFIAASQCARFVLGAYPWPDASGFQETLDYVIQTLDNVLQGNEIRPSEPPPIDLLCSHLTKASLRSPCQSLALQSFIHSSRRNYASHIITQQHPHIPLQSHSFIFPLYNPAAVDIIVFWEVQSQNRRGQTIVHGVHLGAQHADLDLIIEKAETSKVKRSMYAETQREKLELLNGIRNSEWNAEMDPVVVSMPEISEVTHDFRKGPCQVPVTFILRNHSLTNGVRTTFKLRSNKGETTMQSLNLRSAPYSGRLTYRSNISPSQFVIVQPRLLIQRPGPYSLAGWTLQTEVLLEGPRRSSSSDTVQHRYLQQQPRAQEICLLVRDSHTS